MGSALWDLLSDAALSKMGSNSFDDCLKTARELIYRIRERYPNISIYWKSPSAVHIHVVPIPKTIASVSRTQPYLVSRTKYMSSSRVERLHHEQIKLMRELNVPVLDIYEASYLSADWLFVGDGRHYRPELNYKFLSWFYRGGLNRSRVDFNI